MVLYDNWEDHILIEIQEIQRVIDAPKYNISQAVWSIVAPAIWMATSTSTIYGSQRLQSKIQYQSSSLVSSPELSVRILGLSCGCDLGFLRYWLEWKENVLVFIKQEKYKHVLCVKFRIIWF